MRLALALALAAAPVLAEETRTPGSILGARLILPTDRYDHGVLGDAVEWGGLELRVEACPSLPCADNPPDRRLRVTLPASRVFEDVEARVADLDGDGTDEVLVVETDVARGASLAVYDVAGRRAATPFIGTRHRWLAPAGIGDFNGDGWPEIAYVDRPHLLRELVFVRLEKDRLVEIARAAGVTNHRIGDRGITSAVRVCAALAEVLLPDADWTRLIAVRLSGAQAVTQDAGPLPRDFPARLPPCP